MNEKYLPKNVLRKMDEVQINEFENIITPSFKFGELDINQVKDSVYFFS